MVSELVWACASELPSPGRRTVTGSRVVTGRVHALSRELVHLIRRRHALVVLDVHSGTARPTGCGTTDGIGPRGGDGSRTDGRCILSTG